MNSYRLRSGEVIWITTLSVDLALKYAEAIITIHNTIPYQHWSQEGLMAGRDNYREYLGKWELSKCALSEKGDICGFCIGFERQAEAPHYPENCIYMHRMAVAPELQSRGIGVMLHCDALDAAFTRGLSYLRSSSAPVVYGQTNDTQQNKQLIQFHLNAGYRFVDRKVYTDRTDIVMRMTKESFEASIHYAFWKRSKI